MTHYPLAHILTEENRAAGRCTLMLKGGDTAEHPGSKKEKHYIHGPARIDYAIHPSCLSVCASEAPDLAIEAMKEAATAWSIAAERYTDSEPGDDEPAESLWNAGNNLQQAAEKLAELIASGHLIVADLA